MDATPFPCPDNIRRKRTGDRHLKVDGKDRRIRVSELCARYIDWLKEKLGHRSAGRTIEWLLVQVEPCINAILSQKASTSSNTKSPPLQRLPPTMEKSIPTLIPRHKTVLPPLAFCHELELDHMKFSKAEVERLSTTCLSESAGSVSNSQYMDP
ncbi:transcription factor TCP11-like [Lycium ferocissimum]|uniref:transcription factor TCP11-like n=1 Tax=Lycium ferocissimum TaxID=112874 RepID=UPI002815EA3A|nr:transcription factor TCP11-like [Lycium ferocissimum]